MRCNRAPIARAPSASQAWVCDTRTTATNAATPTRAPATRERRPDRPGAMPKSYPMPRPTRVSFCGLDQL
jgi:hypothetical protein